jgi:hypothetical protein
MTFLCQHPEGCLHYCEGTTEMCATHNALERKRLRDEARTQEKEKKARRTAEKTRERAAEKAKAKAPKKQAPIKARTPARAKEERQYHKLRLIHLNKNPECEICGSPATQIHHKAGRIGDLLTDTKYFLGCCFTCHEWIEHHPEKAKEFGYSINRLTV